LGLSLLGRLYAWFWLFFASGLVSFSPLYGICNFAKLPQVEIFSPPTISESEHLRALTAGRFNPDTFFAGMEPMTVTRMILQADALDTRTSKLNRLQVGEWALVARNYLRDAALSPATRKDLAAGVINSSAPESRAKSHLIDALLGSDPENVDRDITEHDNARYENQQPYFGLPPESYSTRYDHLSKIFKSLNLQPGSKIVDLGSAFGRVGFFIGLQYPTVDFVGFEIVPERVREAERVRRHLDIQNIAFKEQNLADLAFTIPTADVYFFYDPVSESTLQKIIGELAALKKKSRSFHIVAIEGRGQLLKTMRSLPWLKDVTPPNTFDPMNANKPVCRDTMIFETIDSFEL